MNDDHPGGPGASSGSLRGPACERAGLLLSLDRDGAATPAQQSELAAHLAGCAPCRTDRETDRLVAGRLRIVTGDGAPPGFSARVVAAALADRVAVAAENRFLRTAAAAAVFVALSAGGFLAVRPATARGIDAGPGVESARRIAQTTIVPSRLAPDR